MSAQETSRHFPVDDLPVKDVVVPASDDGLSGEPESEDAEEYADTLSHGHIDTIPTFSSEVPSDMDGGSLAREPQSLKTSPEMPGLTHSPSSDQQGDAVPPQSAISIRTFSSESPSNLEPQGITTTANRFQPAIDTSGLINVSPPSQEERLLRYQQSVSGRTEDVRKILLTTAALEGVPLADEDPNLRCQRYVDSLPFFDCQSPPDLRPVEDLATVATPTPTDSTRTPMSPGRHHNRVLRRAAIDSNSLRQPERIRVPVVADRGRPASSETEQHDLRGTILEQRAATRRSNAELRNTPRAGQATSVIGAKRSASGDKPLVTAADKRPREQDPRGGSSSTPIAGPSTQRPRLTIPLEEAQGSYGNRSQRRNALLIEPNLPLPPCGDRPALRQSATPPGAPLLTSAARLPAPVHPDQLERSNSNLLNSNLLIPRNSQPLPTRQPYASHDERFALQQMAAPPAVPRLAAVPPGSTRLRLNTGMPNDRFGTLSHLRNSHFSSPSQSQGLHDQRFASAQPGTAPAFPRLTSVAPLPAFRGLQLPPGEPSGYSLVPTDSRVPSMSQRYSSHYGRSTLSHTAPPPAVPGPPSSAQALAAPGQPLSVEEADEPHHAGVHTSHSDSHPTHFPFASFDEHLALPPHSSPPSAPRLPPRNHPTHLDSSYVPGLLVEAGSEPAPAVSRGFPEAWWHGFPMGPPAISWSPARSAHASPFGATVAEVQRPTSAGSYASPPPFPFRSLARARL